MAEYEKKIGINLLQKLLITKRQSNYIEVRNKVSKS